MKLQPTLEATLTCFLVYLEITLSEIGGGHAIAKQLNKEQLRNPSADSLLYHQHDNEILKRKRRYLEFPEGSSFQLVYDLVVGVVDYTNYLILGVTVALAWELPSKPPSEIFNDIRERLKDGSLGTSRNDTAKDIEYAELKSITTASNHPNHKHKLLPMFTTPMHYQYYAPNDIHKSFDGHTVSKYKSKTQDRNKLYSYTWNRTHPFTKWVETKTLPKMTVKGIKYPWWNMRQRLKNSFIPSPSLRRFDENVGYTKLNSNTNKYIRTFPKFRSAGRSEHRIYPVFGKRSSFPVSLKTVNMSSAHHRGRRNGVRSEYLSQLDRIHIKYHRKSRHNLYQRIETYLNGRGSNGHHCVLKALCETGQKSGDRRPGSFVGELMRAIFTMPEPLDATEVGSQRTDSKEQRYDAANALKGDCATRYIHCKESLWSSHFVI